MKRNLFIFTVLSTIFLLSVFQCKKKKLEKGKAITSLVVTIGNIDYGASISNTNITFLHEVPYNTTQVVIKTITLSDGAFADKNVGDVLNVGIINMINVTAEDNSTQDYSVIIGMSSPPPLTFKPVVNTGNISMLSISGATISGTLVDVGTSYVTAHGHVWSTANNPTITGSDISKNDLGTATTSGANFSSAIIGLTENTTYYIRSYATNSIGTGYGDIKNFTTLESAKLGTVSGTEEYVVISGSNTALIAISRVESMGSGNIIQHGHVYSTTFQNKNLVLNNTNVQKTTLGTKAEVGTFISPLPNLNAFTTYYIRPYVITDVSTVYGDTFTFKTPAGSPTVTIETIQISLNDITIYSSIENLGSDNTTVSEYGHIWSTTSGNLTTALSTKTNLGRTTRLLDFNSTAKGLTKNTTYYVVAYAKNNKGIAYSSIQIVKTLNDETKILSLTIENLSEQRVFKQTRSVEDGNISGTTIAFTELPYGTTQAKVSDIRLSDQATASIGVNPVITGSILSVGINNITTKASAGVTQNYVITLSNGAGIPPEIVTLSATDIKFTTANLNGEINNTGDTAISNYGFIYSTHSGATLTLTGNSTVISVGNNIENRSFTQNLTKLRTNTTYYFTAYSTNDGGTSYGEIQSFKTDSYILPSITTLSATHISPNTATLNGEITSTGNTSISGYGFIYSTTSGDSLTLTGSGTVLSLGSNIDTENFSHVLTGLIAHTPYYIAAYATNEGGTSYGQTIKFTTEPYILPSITTLSATHILAITTTLNAEVTNTGNTPISGYGFIYSTTSGDSLTLTGSGAVLSVGSNIDTEKFSHVLTGLMGNTTYYFVAYATNEGGTRYGQTIKFTTDSYTLPSVTILSVTHILATTTNLNAEVTSTGNTPISGYGFIYSTTSGVSLTLTGSGTVVSVGSNIDTENFSHVLTGLMGDTTYYIAAYATNRAGTSYGQTIKFTTDSYILPSVTTLSASHILATTATLNAEVTDVGNTPMNGYGFIYSTTSGDSLTLTGNSSVVSVGSSIVGNQQFSHVLTGLMGNTTYYIAAYAANEGGTSYGQTIKFTTESYTLPNISTLSATSVEFTTVSLNAEVINIGNTPISGYGFIYSTDSGAALTLTGNNTVISLENNISIGEFTYSLTGLSDNSTYYYTSYITNEGGTSYGQPLNFTTKTYVLPSVTTLSATSVEFVTTTLNGEVINTGNPAISTYGFIYSADNSALLTLDGRGTIISLENNIGVGNFSYDITGINDNTIYYYVAYTTNEGGTSYGQTVNFTTKTYVLPSVTTLSATSVEFVTAMLNGEVTNTGNTPISSYGFIYSTTTGSALTLTGNGTLVQVGSNTETGTFTRNLTGLNDNTTYYYVAYTTNEGGTSYGTTRIFTTQEYTLPEVSTTSANASGTDVTLVGNISSIGAGSTQINQHGFVYSSNVKGEDLVLNRSGVTAVSLGSKNSVGSFTHALSLNSYTTYSIKAYATNNKGTSYGNTRSVTTTTQFIEIPDANFRNAIISCINNGRTRINTGNPADEYTLAYHCRENYNGPAVVSGNAIRQDVLEAITSFRYSNKNHTNNNSIRISNVTGIEYMIASTLIDLEENSLTTNLTPNTFPPSVVTLIVSNNSLTNVDVSNLTSLNWLDVSSNSLTSLDVSSLGSLKTLYVDDNSDLTCIQTANGQTLLRFIRDNGQSLSTNCGY